jgi:hypothetical protein
VSRFTDAPRPAFQRSIVRLYCEGCGSETDATCSCGKPYVPAAARVAEYDAANPGKSTRDAAADLGVSNATVSRARGVTCVTPQAVTGHDGKTYPAARAEKKAASIELGRRETARLKKKYGEKLDVPPVQEDLLAEAEHIVNQMNWSTKDVFSQWLATVYEK